MTNLHADPSVQRDWCGLEPGLIELIISKLSFINIIRFDAACSDWHSITQSYVKSSRYTPCPQLPWLFLFPSRNSCRVFNLEENKIFDLRKQIVHEEEDFWCIGSSYGWLIFLSRIQKIPYLASPFVSRRSKIILPPFRKIYPSCSSDHYYHHTMKAILLSDPSYDDNATIVILLKNGRMDLHLVFYKMGGDMQEWGVAYNNSNMYPLYSDIIYSNDERLVYALRTDSTIESWDFHNCDDLAVLKMRIHVGCTYQPTRDVGYHRGCIFRGDVGHLVISSGKILLLHKYIIEEGMGVVCHGEDDLQSGLVCERENKTTIFNVYELDPDKRLWIHKNSLGGKTLAVGRGGYPASFSSEDFSTTKIKEDLIYFTDCGKKLTYDHGAFYYQRENLVTFKLQDITTIYQPAFWITPNEMMILRDSLSNHNELVVDEEV